ncbi:RNA polymerase sigma-70 factor, ECF subfamily [Amphibacillus marinus]|uniref:RNA polymerase sigma-70 factor, ECF subfamily n=1 Tax=Amphibacillus marinus TaxID=872970 RepID=A0A1H8LSP9_9BACI|nr:sigma-70 family RNA polymerase sigma factor [Amphibacillus marinus]SEO08167.1 RNA polymerase sigma-70 factor, ECF subfamily [Amphibacillus marinus]
MKLTNDNFIKLLRKGKHEALEYVVDHYSGIVKAVVVNKLSTYQDYQLIEECISDVFIAAFTNAKQFNGDALAFRKWLCTIAKYKAIDRQRSLLSKPSFAELEEHVHVVESAEEQVLRQQTAKQLLHKLTKLKEVDRNIFIMKYFLDMSNQAIAKQLNLSKAAIDNRLYRGKKKLHHSGLGGWFYENSI